MEKFNSLSHSRYDCKYHVVFVPKFGKKSLPPGLAKKLARGGTLPPGWQMKVARGEVMDYEVYNNASPLPEELLRKLYLHFICFQSNV
jgi:hypothetical protein